MPPTSFLNRPLPHRTLSAALLALSLCFLAGAWLWWTQQPGPPPGPAPTPDPYGQAHSEGLRGLRIASVFVEPVELSVQMEPGRLSRGPKFHIMGIVSPAPERRPEGFRFLDPPSPGAAALRGLGEGRALALDLQRAEAIRVLHEGGVPVSAPADDIRKQQAPKLDTLTAGLEVGIRREPVGSAVAISLDWNLYRSVSTSAAASQGARSGAPRLLALRAELLHGGISTCLVRPEDVEAAELYLVEESMKDLARLYREQNATKGAGREGAPLPAP